MAYCPGLSTSARPSGGEAAGTGGFLGIVGATRRRCPCWAAWTTTRLGRRLATAPGRPRDGSGRAYVIAHVISVT